VSAVAGVNQATAWGAQTAQAIGANNSLARTSQRSREFLVEPHELQQLPPSAVIVSYASAAGRRVVLADANPGIGGLPSATLRGRDEPGPAAAAGWAAGTAWPARATGEPALAGPPPGFGTAGPGQEWTQTVVTTAETDHIRSRDSTAQTGRRPVPSRRAAPAAWGGPVSPPSRDPADAPLSWRDDGA
jgi:hypothetical protein